MLTFSIGTCRIKLRFSCFALFAFCCLFAGIANGAFLLLSIGVHELSHLAAMCVLRFPPVSIELSSLGCRLEPDLKKRPGYRQNVMISLAGPLGNMVSFFVMALFGAAGHSFAASSLVLGVLHSLPIEPLDGGLALRAFFSWKLGPVKAEKITLAVSLTFLFPLAVLGFLLVLHTKGNLSLLALSVYLMLYLVLKREDLSL